jgi:hypothetical protein
VVIDRLTAKEQEDSPLTPTLGSDGALFFDRPAGNGEARIFGRVFWNRDDDPTFKNASEVRVYVNGFQQRSGQLLPVTVGGDKRPERRFVVSAVLSQAKDNRVEVVLPGLKQRSASRREVAVGCAAPVAITRLHVLPIVIRPRKAAAIDDKKLEATLRSLFPNVTGSVRRYPALVGFVSPQALVSRLLDIKQELDTSANDGSTNDLVVIYYQGGEVFEGSGHYLTTSVTEVDPDMESSAVACDQLAEVFGKTLGAQVLLLDVDRRVGASTAADRAQDGVSQWPDQPNVAVVRYSRRQTAEPQLLPDLSRAFGDAKRLVDVMNGLRNRLVWSSEKGEWLLPESRSTVVDWRVSPQLGSLPVRPGR